MYEINPIVLFHHFNKVTMFNPNQTIHHTAVKPITGAEGEGWEFLCSDCAFQMRYYLPECSEGARLEVISLGDVFARHLSKTASLVSGRDKFAEDGWLTPDIRQTIEKIVKKLDV